MTYELHTHNPNPSTPYAERNDHDFYPTPYALCQAAVNLIKLPDIEIYPFVLDPGAGTGVWGKAVQSRWPRATTIGVECRSDADCPKTGYDSWIHSNFILWQYKSKFDLIVGNPPYGDAWDQEQKKLVKEAKKIGIRYKRPPRPADCPVADAEAFIWKAKSLLEDDGHMMFLLRLAFLEGGKRGSKLWKEFPPKTVYVLSNRPSFMPVGSAKAGKTDSTAYALFEWENNYLGPTSLVWLNWK